MKPSRWENRFDNAIIGGLAVIAFGLSWRLAIFVACWAAISAGLRLYDEYRNSKI
jgi:hypothetical protein